MSQRRELQNSLGQRLVSHWHEPSAPAKGSVIIACAIGIEQAYYQSFAAWLAEQGYLCVTFDYIGVGQSLTGPLKFIRNTAKDWAKHDCSSVLAAVKAAQPQVPLYWLGHSLGGQIVPFIDGNQQIDKIINVACGSGYWKTNNAHSPAQALLLWYGLLPVLTPIFGYFPGKRLKLIGDLPAKVAKEWRSWCLNPRYAAGAAPDHQALYSLITQPLTSIAFSDDELISEGNVHALNACFDQAKVNFRLLNPKDFGTSRVGHMGFFRKQQRDTLWPEVLRELA